MRRRDGNHLLLKRARSARTDAPETPHFTLGKSILIRHGVEQADLDILSGRARLRLVLILGLSAAFFPVLIGQAQTDSAPVRGERGAGLRVRVSPSQRRRVLVHVDRGVVVALLDGELRRRLALNTPMPYGTGSDPAQ